MALSEIVRDFKKFTSKKIIGTMQSEPESRKEWMLDYFKNSCAHLVREQNYKFAKMVIMQRKFFQTDGLKRK